MKKHPKKPSKLLIGSVLLLSKKKFYKNYHLEIDKTEIESLKPPFIVLYNHVGNSDHFVTGITLYPLLANNFASRWVSRQRLNGILSNLAGCIYKDRFIPDAESVFCAKRVLKEQKGIVALAPAASYSFDGTPNFFDFGVAKFVKLFKLPVVSININGLYFWKNRFLTKKSKSCHIKVKASIVFNGDEVSSMDNVSVYKKLYEACDFNDCKWQAKTNNLIVNEDKTSNLDHLCYKCLNCGEEFTNRVENGVLVCHNCGNKVTLNERFAFSPIGESVYVDRIDQYHAIQRNFIEKEIENDDFCISQPCQVSHYTENKKYGVTKYGEGVLTLNRKGFDYVGSDKGKQVAYHFPIERLTNVGSETGQYISIDSHDDVNRFLLADMRVSTKMIVALNIMRLKYFPNFENELEWIKSLPSYPNDIVIHGKPQIEIPLN